MRTTMRTFDTREEAERFRLNTVYSAVTFSRRLFRPEGEVWVLTYQGNILHTDGIFRNTWASLTPDEEKKNADTDEIRTPENGAR